MGRITWVCATCSEHFTRQYGATRHNNKLHDGKGVVVRLLDYIVGVANGRFLPSESNSVERNECKVRFLVSTLKGFKKITNVMHMSR